MTSDELLEIHAQSIRGFIPAIDSLESSKKIQEDCENAVQRGYFRPEEESNLQYWFATFLGLRSQLWENIEDLHSFLGDYQQLDREKWPFFITGYCHICILVRLDFLLVEKVANHSLIQRKLNEAVTSHRIPRKQYTKIFKSLTSLRHGKAMQGLMEIVENNPEQIKGLQNHPIISDIVQNLPHFQTYMDPSIRRFFRRYVQYRSHALRRRWARIFEVTFFGILETTGRVLASLPFFGKKKVTQVIRNQLAQKLEPGDVIVTRHHNALTNVFLPGFWPHAALYVGSVNQREKLKVITSDQVKSQWAGSKCVLEALKDGVHFRPLHRTLNVDAFLVLRPNLNADQIRQAIQRVIPHAGKPYNFDFDFFRSDRLVCTEVIYRAFDSQESIKFNLKDRAGRKTLSAEDLVDLTESEDLKVVAGFGFKGCRKQIAWDDKAANCLKKLRAKA